MFDENPVNAKTVTDRILSNVSSWVSDFTTADRDLVAAGGMFGVLTGHERSSFANKYPAIAELLARTMQDFGHIRGAYGSVSAEALWKAADLELKGYFKKHPSRMNPHQPEIERKLHAQGFRAAGYGPHGETFYHPDKPGVPVTVGWGGAFENPDEESAAEWYGHPETRREVEALVKDAWDDMDAKESKMLLWSLGFDDQTVQLHLADNWSDLPLYIQREVRYHLGPKLARMTETNPKESSESIVQGAIARGHITEKEINLLTRRVNDGPWHLGFDSPERKKWEAEVRRPILDLVPEEGIPVSREQMKKGLAWLKQSRIYKNKLGYREQNIVDNLHEIRWIGWAPGERNDYLYTYYRPRRKDGWHFYYKTEGGDIHVLG